MGIDVSKTSRIYDAKCELHSRVGLYAFEAVGLVKQHKLIGAWFGERYISDCVAIAVKDKYPFWALDHRSLAVLRFCLASLAFSQAIILLRLPSVVYVLDVPAQPQALSTALRWIGFLMVVVAAPLFAAGVLTRFSNGLTFAGLVVVQNEIPRVLQGGDVLLRLLLFWSLFLPLGDRWSLDSRFWKRTSDSQWLWTSTLASWALTLQVCFVYWVAALLKSDPLWTKTGNALFYALNIEHFTAPVGLSLRQVPELLRPVSLALPWFELLAPFLLFVPFRGGVCRMSAVILFVAFHLIGMQLLLRIGLFPWVCATAWLVFIPGFFWDWIERQFADEPKTEPAKQAISKKKRRNAPRTLALWDYAGSTLVIISFLDVLAWNIASLIGMPAFRWLEVHDGYGHTLRLDQRWNMYAPAPRRSHGWLVVPADLPNTTQIDLFTGKPVSWEKPQDIGAYFGGDRSRRYLSNLFDDQDPKALQDYADYLVRNWNQSHGEDQQIQTVTIIFMRQETQPDLTVTEPKKDVLYFHAY